MSAPNDQFYAELPLNSMPLGDLLARKELFYSLPDDWQVIITDIKNSTQAVFNQQHQTVNLVATGSIVAVLNIAFRMQLTIPFFFGGDGATFIVPPSILGQAMQALSLYKVNTQANFNLEIRIGAIPVQEVFNQGHELRISKFNSSPIFSIPIVLGYGLTYAEKQIKGRDYLVAEYPMAEKELDLSGMQCRWDRIAPPKDTEEVVTLLIISKEVARQAIIFRQVMNKLDALYGLPQKRQPISIPKLRLKTSFNQLSVEMRARYGTIRLFELIGTRILCLFGYMYFHTLKGKKYLESLVAMSDTLVMDGKINTVISGTVQQRKLLQSFLDELEATGDILYGMHVSNACIMSCYVRNMEEGHIHFVDGSEGGYTQAAKMLKAKLRSG